jgi:hypothetical protein
MTKLPAPEQWVLTKMNEMETAEMIEQHIDYYKDDKNCNRRSVHLPTQFVRHYMNRDDGVLPTVVAVATPPIVLADGGLLMPKGLDRLRGIVFEIQKEVRALMPRREDCAEDEVRKAMKFLCDDWLCDVNTDLAGKCMIISAALTMIERSLLDQRPAFFVTSGRRGSGKTTLLQMLIYAITGISAAAAAWSTVEEERRKAVMSFFLYGVSYILWDNIAKGSKISCPHIERSCTSAYYSDRRLGVSEIVATAASTIHLFTGNNIAPTGDLASRSMMIRLDTDRHDPENRAFEHPDPMGWTENNRAEILRAFYVILLGNPQLSAARDAAMKTRFKMWWRLVGSAVEHAATLYAGETGSIDFQKLFLSREEDDEETAALVDVLSILSIKFAGWNTFKASDVAKLFEGQDSVWDDPTDKLASFFAPKRIPDQKVSSKVVGKLLSENRDNPVLRGDATLILRTKVVDHASVYWIEKKGSEG